MIKDTQEVLQSLDLNWRFFIAVVIFCLWPLTAVLIYLTDKELFKEVDVLKLSLLCSGISTPFFIVNTLLSTRIFNPKDPELRYQAVTKNYVSIASIFGALSTAFILAIGCIYNYLNVDDRYTTLVIGILEGVFIVSMVTTVFLENRRSRPD